MLERRRALGGCVPQARRARASRCRAAAPRCSRSSTRGTGENAGGLDHHGVRQAASATCCATRPTASAWCRSSPTRRARSAWRCCSARSASTPGGQKYEPVDSKLVLSYTEKTDGQLLEEGITEAGSMASFTAAGTSYAMHGETMIPFYIFYSMFGFQRTRDLIWAFGDARGRGFMLGATAGRTTLNGEGLQHEDGHSHAAGLGDPELRRLRSGVRVRSRGHRAGRPAAHVRGGRGHLLLHHALQSGLHACRRSPRASTRASCRGFTATAPPRPPTPSSRRSCSAAARILLQALRAQEMLAEKWDVAADVWSVTSYAAAAQRRARGRALEPPAPDARRRACRT